jgi:D-alanine-D-alanine ligase
MENAKMTARIGVVMGGSSGEREVSLRSGKAVVDALKSRGHEVVSIVLGPTADVASTLRKAKIDVAFLALHGRLGEDGCVQGVCELYGIPYTGSSVLASALAMDKAKAKELFRLYNVPTPPYYTVTEEQATDLEELHGSFGFPVVVKPRGEGSSLGICRADSMSDLSRAVRDALQYDRVALVERFITGREITVGVLDGRVLGCCEIAPKSGMYDYEAKYTSGATEYFLPARIPATRLRGVMNLAERAARALGCTSAVRVDLLVTEGENEYVLEVNTQPGMTETSLLPKIASHAGYDFAALCEAIVATATLHSGASPKRTKSETELKATAIPTKRAAGALDRSTTPGRGSWARSWVEQGARERGSLPFLLPLSRASCSFLRA